MNAVVTNRKYISRLIRFRLVQGFYIILLFGILGFTPIEQSSLTEIRRVSFATRADGQGIVIRLHAKAPLNAYSEPRFDEDHKIEVILFNAKLASSYKSDSPSDPVIDFAVNEQNGHLVFQFSLDDAITVETAAYPDQASNDLLVGVTLLEDQRNGQLASAGKSADRGQKLPEINVKKISNEPVAPVEQKIVTTTNVVSAQANTNRGTDSKKDRQQNQKKSSPPKDSGNPEVMKPIPVSSASLTTEEKAERWTLDTVVIDAGHGGHDPGAVANGVQEKDVNLAVALKLGTYLEKILKVNVIYTRTDDNFVELQERGHIANQAGAKLFISIHSNSAPYSSKVTGTETYILGLHRTEKAEEVMERENSVVSLEANPDQYNAFYQNSILRTLAISANLRMSEKLAGEIENQFTSRVHRQSRGVKQAGLIVLWAASMPAVLVELGYLTNRFEAAYLNSHQGQDYLASAIFRAVRDFKAEYDKGLNLPAAN